MRIRHRLAITIAFKVKIPGHVSNSSHYSIVLVTKYRIQTINIKYIYTHIYQVYAYILH